MNDTQYASLDELRERRDEARHELTALEVRSRGRKFDPDDRELYASLVEEIKDLNETLEERVKRENLLLRLAHTDAAVPAFDPGPHGDSADAAVHGLARDQALRTIDRNKDVLSPEAGDGLTALVRDRDPLGIDSRYIAAVADPAYKRAFGKMVEDPTTGHLRFTPEEVAAVQRVSASMAERAMSVGTRSAGGFAVPFTLDPSVLLSSNGALNPTRDLARVIQVGTREWKGVSSLGVTASFDAEASEVSDDSPVLVQPSVVTQGARCFVPFSIELGQDWGSIQDELLRLFSDAKDVLESSKFLTGTGTNEPVGILTIGTAGALTTTQRVQTDVAATLDIEDVWDVKGNITNTRFASSATFVGNSAMFDRIYRFTPAGSTTEPQAMPTREGPLCGIPKRDWSDMVNTTTTGSKVLIVGDWSNFFIGDRIGMTAELIPHLFATANNLPSGQRGLFAMWRTGTVVAVPNAFRYLEVL